MFAGARLPVWQAYLVPIVLMLITDPIRAAFYGVPAFSRYQLFSYGSFLISVWLGRRLRNSESVPKITGLAVINSMQFFLFTNFASWLWFGIYPRTATGLASCYAAAIPFFGWTLASDLLFTAVLFSLHAWLSRSLASRERVALAA